MRQKNQGNYRYRSDTKYALTTKLRKNVKFKHTKIYQTHQN